MKKYCTRILRVFLCIITIFMLCSWVDPQTVDVYSGTIRINNSSGYNVTNLSGDLQFYLDSYRQLGYDSWGYVYNPTPDYYNGLALISGTEYPCRMYPNGGFQIQQVYTTSGYDRNVWIDYQLSVPELPTGFSIPEFAIIFIAIAVFFLVAINLLIRGFLL